MAKMKQKTNTGSKTNLLKIVDPLQKLLDQRAALDAQIAEMKKSLIAAIENEEAPAPAKPKPAAGRKPKADKAEKPAKSPRGRKAGAKKADAKKDEEL